MGKTDKEKGREYMENSDLGAEFKQKFDNSKIFRKNIMKKINKPSYKKKAQRYGITPNEQWDNFCYNLLDNWEDPIKVEEVYNDVKHLVGEDRENEIENIKLEFSRTLADNPATKQVFEQGWEKAHQYKDTLGKVVKKKK